MSNSILESDSASRNGRTTAAPSPSPPPEEEATRSDEVQGLPNASHECNGIDAVKGSSTAVVLSPRSQLPPSSLANWGSQSQPIAGAMLDVRILCDAANGGSSTVFPNDVTSPVSTRGRKRHNKYALAAQVVHNEIVAELAALQALEAKLEEVARVKGAQHERPSENEGEGTVPLSAHVDPSSTAAAVGGVVDSTPPLCPSHEKQEVMRRVRDKRIVVKVGEALESLHNQELWLARRIESIERRHSHLKRTSRSTNSVSSPFFSSSAVRGQQEQSQEQNTSETTSSAFEARFGGSDTSNIVTVLPSCTGIISLLTTGPAAGSCSVSVPDSRDQTLPPDTSDERMSNETTTHDGTTEEAITLASRQGSSAGVTPTFAPDTVEHLHQSPLRRRSSNHARRSADNTSGSGGATSSPESSNESNPPTQEQTGFPNTSSLSPSSQRSPGSSPGTATIFPTKFARDPPLQGQVPLKNIPSGSAFSETSSPFSDVELDAFRFTLTKSPQRLQSRSSNGDFAARPGDKYYEGIVLSSPTSRIEELSDSMESTSSFGSFSSACFQMDGPPFRRSTIGSSSRNSGSSLNMDRSEWNKRVLRMHSADEDACDGDSLADARSHKRNCKPPSFSEEALHASEPFLSEIIITNEERGVCTPINQQTPTSQPPPTSSSTSASEALRKQQLKKGLQGSPAFVPLDPATSGLEFLKEQTGSGGGGGGSAGGGSKNMTQLKTDDKKVWSRSMDSMWSESDEGMDYTHRSVGVDSVQCSSEGVNSASTSLGDL